MRLDDFHLRFLGHAGRHIAAAGGAAMVPDPLFLEHYVEGSEGIEYLTPPPSPAAAIRRCDAIFVSPSPGDPFFARSRTFWSAFSCAEQKRRMTALLKPDYPILIPRRARRAP